MSLKNGAYKAPLFYMLLILGLSYLLYHSLAGGTLLAHNVYDSYALQAANWLAGRNYIANGEHYTWLELAIYAGRYYQSFPPVPAVALLPWVALFGEAAVPSNLIIAFYGLLTATGVYCFFMRSGFSAQRCVFWAVLCCMGSNFYWMSTSGGVWFQAQVLNLCLVVWGLYFAAKATTAQHTAAAFLLALAVGCRPFSLLILALLMLKLLAQESGFAPINGAQKRTLHCPGKGFWLPFAAALFVGAAMAGYNYARFGSIFEFGHSYLPEFQQAANGQFSGAYFGVNLLQLLRPVTLTAGLDLQFPLFNGFLPFVANPVFLIGAVALFRKIKTQHFTSRDAVSCAAFATGLVFLCLHKTMGGWQFGARYTVDLIPYVLLAAVSPDEARDTPVRGWEAFLCAAAVLFNLYGAVYMLNH